MSRVEANYLSGERIENTSLKLSLLLFKVQSSTSTKGTGLCMKETTTNHPHHGRYQSRWLILPLLIEYSKMWHFPWSELRQSHKSELRHTFTGLNIDNLISLSCDTLSLMWVSLRGNTIFALADEPKSLLQRRYARNKVRSHSRRRYKYRLSALPLSYLRFASCRAGGNHSRPVPLVCKADCFVRGITSFSLNLPPLIVQRARCWHLPS